ncbi:MAG TPA: hypothetical protein VMZ74_17325 [Ramlibacter sp.]|nr:hypothetical protein [Ramlibacter sp.]
MHGPAIEAFAPLARLVGRVPRRRVGDYSVYSGDGEAVLVMPEYAHGPESTRELRNVLHHAGFAVHDWGLGVDNGPGHGLDRLLRRIEERVIDVFEAEHGSVTLIGCGLSGIYAREVAKRTTPIVRQVITIGSPVRVTDPRGRCKMLDALFEASAGIDRMKLNRLRQRPPVPCTSIFSMTDEAVPTQFAEEPESITTENVAVPAKRHADLMHHPKTLEAITFRIARSDEEWRLFEG